MVGHVWLPLPNTRIVEQSGSSNLSSSSRRFLRELDSLTSPTPPIVPPQVRCDWTFSPGTAVVPVTSPESRLQGRRTPPAGAEAQPRPARADHRLPGESPRARHPRRSATRVVPLAFRGQAVRSGPRETKERRSNLAKIQVMWTLELHIICPHMKRMSNANGAYSSRVYIMASQG